MSETIRTNRARRDKGPQDARTNRIDPETIAACQPNNQRRFALAQACDASYQPTPAGEKQPLGQGALADIATTLLGETREHWLTLGVRRGRPRSKGPVVERLCEHVDMAPPNAEHTLRKHHLRALLAAAGVDPDSAVRTEATP